ncbi:MAG: type II toxin-antitoxin system HipA family toxin, partial [Chlamydiia bacterium]
RSTEGAWIFLSKRFDLGPQQQHLVVEDFCQLLGLAEEKKYEASLEQVATALLQFSRTPDQDRTRLWKVAVVAWLIGNADLHLKNLSMLEGRLSPAYDMVPTQLILPSPEETALSLCSKRARFRRKHWVEEFGERILGIPRAELEEMLLELRKAANSWPEIIAGIPLPEVLQKRAIDAIAPRLQELLTLPQ